MASSASPRERRQGARRRRHPEAARPVIIHSADHARAAVTAAAELGVPVILHSAPGAAGTAGPGWFREVVAQAHATAPSVRVGAVLDCGEAPGLALAALRAGVAAIALRAPRPVHQKIAAIARQHGASVVGAAPRTSLDLLAADDPAAACRDYLSKT